VPAALQLITANRLRAQIGAAYMTFINLIGTFVGPLLVGVVSDYAAGDAQGLRYAMALVAGITTPLMVLLMSLARRPYRDLRKQGEAWPERNGIKTQFATLQEEGII
jgi:MFS family permease